MRKIVCVLAFLAVFAGVSRAGDRGRFEVSVGPVYPMMRVDGFANRPFGVLSLGYMRGFGDSGLWAGAEVAVGAAARKVLWPVSETSSDYESCRTVSLCLAADVAFAGWERGEAFVGVSAGVAQRATFCPDLAADRVVGPCVNPRFGLVLWDRMKVSLEGRFTHGYYNTVGMRIGFVF